MSLDRELVAVEAPRLLILRALGLGDLLTAVPALRGLARAFPEHRRTLAAPHALQALLSLMKNDEGEPVVHELLDANLLAPAALERGRIADGLNGGGPPQVAVNLHGRGAQSHRVLLQTHPERMIAFAHPDIPESSGGPRWRAGEHEVARWCRMLGEHGVQCEQSRLDIEAPDTPEADLPPGAHGATVIHPGAASAARRWPSERWAAVAAAERITGRRVLLTGTRKEAPLARSIAEAADLPASCVLAGRTTMTDLATLIAAAGRTVCGDTGVGHLATALGTPSVLLFGPAPPNEWGPPPSRTHHRVLWTGTTGDPHADTPDPGLLRITVTDVLDALEQLD